MLTGGQVTSLSTGGGALSPTACDFEPNIWLNLLPIDGLESDAAPPLPNRLPPPHPDRTAPPTASASAMRRWPARPGTTVRIISLLRVIQKSPRRLKINRALERSARLARYISAMAANPRRVPKSRNRRLTAKILVQQTEQQMVLPDAGNAEGAPPQSLPGEAALLQHPDRGR